MAEVAEEKSSLISVIAQALRGRSAADMGSAGARECRSLDREIRMPRHRVSVTFSLTAKQVELLDRLAQRTNVPKSVYVRKGVDVILRKYRGMLSGAGPTAAEEDEKR
jgi:hypothetical protein